MSSLELNYKRIGDQQNVLFILHGLFGSLDNWLTLGKRFSEHYSVYLIDLRNHGFSPHTQYFTIQDCAQDIVSFSEENQIDSFSVIGHSFGGKTSMQLSISNPQLVRKLVVADIGPKEYPPHHQLILNALQELKPEKISSRKDAEEKLVTLLDDFSTTQFFVKNLIRNENGGYKWKFNLESIVKNILEVGKAQEGKCSVPTLFLKGENSHYILDTDEPRIKSQFINGNILTINGAGHWLHADQPDLFYQNVIDFLLK